MGVEARQVLYAHSEDRARQAATAAFEAMDALDTLLSDWRVDNPVAGLAAAEPGQAVTIDADMAEVMRVGLDLADASHGAFDPTLGPVVKLWRAAALKGEEPSFREIGEAYHRIGYPAVELDGRQLTFHREGLELDFGGIGKGFACDRALEVLGDHGIESALVELGGDLAVSASPPERAAWFVEVGCGGEGELPPRVVALEHQAVSTSGGSAQAWTLGDKTYSHIIGLDAVPLAPGPCQTVIAPRAALSDGLATAASVLFGGEHARTLVKNMGGQLLEQALEPSDFGRVESHGEELFRAGPWRDLLAGDLAHAWEAEEGGSVHAPDDYALVDGVLAIPSSAPSGHLRTRDDFEHFQLRLDFRQARMCNSGVFLRAARDGRNPAYSGCEVQLLDDHHWEQETGTTLQPWQFTASLYGAMAPADARLAPVGEWNSLEILFLDSHLTVTLNGRVVYAVDTRRLDADPPFSERATRGFLGLQRYASPDTEGETALWVRNAFVREYQRR